MTIKKYFLLFATMLLALSCCNSNKNNNLPRYATPEDANIHSVAIARYLEACNRSDDEMHRFMIVRNGKVVVDATWKPYEANDKQLVYSCSKTFTATAIGMLIDDGVLSLDDKVISFFKDELPDSISPNLASMTIRNLLTMSAGHDPEPFDIRLGKDWVRNFFAYPVVNEPGTVFKYNTMGSFMLSAIVQKVTGKRMFDFLQKRLFVPLEIKNVDWEISPEGITNGGSGFRCHIEDMAKLGVLYLQKGKWQGKQIVSEEWVKEAMKAHILQNPDADSADVANSDWLQGYGYQMWLCRKNNGVRADGAFGQFIIMLPKEDVVIAIQSNSMNTQEELNRVWDYILPGISKQRVKRNDMGYAVLCNALAALSIAPPVDDIVPANMKVDIKQGDTLQIKISGDTCVFVWNNYNFVFGHSKWFFGTTKRAGWNIGFNKETVREFPPFKIACGYSWEDEKRLALYIKYLESPHTEKIIVSFNKDGSVSLTDIKRFL
jgi:CubicO group peptidase (beta-lactamase class C family)